MNTSVDNTNTLPLTEQLMQHLQGQPLAQIAGQLGIAPEQARSAAALAVPLLLGALGRNAQQPQGAQDLLQALQRDHMPNTPQPAAAAGLDLGGLLGSVLGGMAAGRPGGAGPLGDGAAILGHILGGARAQAETGLGQASGLGSNAGQFLQLLAPIVMAFLAQRVRGAGLGAEGLGGLLGREQAHTRQANAPAADLLTRVLDQDGNGRVDLGDLLKLGAGLLGGRR